MMKDETLMACFCFLSCCLPFFLHPSWCRCRRWLYACVCMCMCARTAFAYVGCFGLFVVGFRDAICDFTPLLCVCHVVVCIAVVRVSVCVLLCGCLSLVSIFIFRKCCRCWRPSTPSCKPTLSCTRASCPSRRSTSGRRSLACRCAAFT